MIASASVCVCQLEINPEVTHFTLSLAKKAGGMFSREKVITLGCKGSVIGTQENPIPKHIPVTPADPVDSTVSFHSEYKAMNVLKYEGIL